MYLIFSEHLPHTRPQWAEQTQIPVLGEFLLWQVRVERQTVNNKYNNYINHTVL